MAEIVFTESQPPRGFLRTLVDIWRMLDIIGYIASRFAAVALLGWATYRGLHGGSLASYIVMGLGGVLVLYELARTLVIWEHYLDKCDQAYKEERPTDYFVFLESAMWDDIRFRVLTLLLMVIVSVGTAYLP